MLHIIDNLTLFLPIRQAGHPEETGALSRAYFFRRGGGNKKDLPSFSEREIFPHQNAGTRLPSQVSMMYFFTDSLWKAFTNFWYVGLSLSSARAAMIFT